MGIFRFMLLLAVAFSCSRLIEAASSLGNAFGYVATQLRSAIAAPAHYAKIHQGELLVSAVGGALVYFFCRTIYLHAYLLRSDAWSLWQSLAIKDIPGQDVLGCDLVRAIQARYPGGHKNRDTASQLEAFIFDVEREIGALQEYTYLVSMIKRLQLAGMLHTLIDEQLLKRVDARLERLFELKKRCHITFLEGILS